MPTVQQTDEYREILNILDPGIGHFADKLAKWKFKIPEFLRGLVFMVKGDIGHLLDFDRMKVVSPENITDILQASVSDLVFTVPFRDPSQGDELTIYILLEHQSTMDRMMGYRLLSYMCQIWHDQLKQLANSGVKPSHQRLHPILPIVFYTGERRWNAPVTLNAVMDVPEQMKPFVPSFETLFLGVKQVDTDELTQTDHPFAWLMTVLQKEQEDENVMQRTLETALTQLDTIKTENPTLHRNAMMYLSLIVRCRREKHEQTPLLRMINTHTENEEVESIIMTGIEAILQEGKAEALEQGIEQGIEQGKKEHAVEAILTVLEARFKTDVAEKLKSFLSTIDDLQHLDHLTRIAAQASDIDAFTQILLNLEN